MQTKVRKRVPVNIIAGGLGVGKTTAINHLLRQRPEQEQWAVLINEYGEIGVDSALLTGGDARAENGRIPGVEVREVAGGCICCSAGIMFEMSLVLMLGRAPDRLLIEPTGLASLTGTIRTLQAPGLRDAVELRSIIALVDPARWATQVQTPEDEDRIAAADIVLANRCDRATQDQVDQFVHAMLEVFPPKAEVGVVEHASIDLSLLDQVSAERPFGALKGAQGFRAVGHAVGARVSGSALALGSGGQVPAVSLAIEAPSPDEQLVPGAIVCHANRTPAATTLGWRIHGDTVFDGDRLAQWMQSVGGTADTLRLKAIVHTTAGWWTYNVVEGETEARRAGWSRASRIELVCAPGSELDAASLQEALRASIHSAEHGESACRSTAT